MDPVFAFTPDIRTLAFLLLAVALLAGVVFGGLWLQLCGDRAVGYWAAAHGLGTVGFLLIGLRDRVPDALSIIVANVLLFVALGFLFKGLRLKLGRPFPERLFWLLIAVLAIGYTYFTLWQFNLEARIIIGSIAGVTLLGGCASTLLMVPASERTGVHLFTAIGFLAIAGAQLWSIASAVTGVPFYDFMEAPAAHGISLMTLLLGIVIWTFGLLWLTAFGWRNELIQELAIRRRREQTLQENEQRFRAIFDNSANGIAFADKEGKLLLVNQAFAALVGYPVSELLHKDLFALTHPDDRAIEASLVEQLLTSEESYFRLEKRYLTRDGHIVWVELTVSAIRDEQGAPLRLVAVTNEIGERKALQEKLEHQATHDPLTGILNRRHFYSLLEREQERVNRYRSLAALIMIDFDNFKSVNDAYGHAVGDFLLHETAELFRNRLRESDILARWGGEEFLLLLPETGIEGASLLAEELRQAVAAHSFNNLPSIRISLGFTGLYPGEEIQSPLKRVDKALYAAKAAGRNRASLA